MCADETPVFCALCLERVARVVATIGGFRKLVCQRCMKLYGLRPFLGAVERTGGKSSAVPAPGTDRDPERDHTTPPQLFRGESGTRHD